MNYQDIDQEFLGRLLTLKRQADERGIPAAHRQIRIGIEYAKRLFPSFTPLAVYGMEIHITSEIWEKGKLIQLWVTPPAEKIGEI